MEFLYFLETDLGALPPEFDALADVLARGAETAQVRIPDGAGGPLAGKRGLLIRDSYGEDPARFRYDGKSQEWIEKKQWRGQWLWAGVETEARPTPQALARPHRHQGKDMLLGDGHVWRVPVLRYYTGDIGLPASVAIDATTGAPIYRVLQEYRALGERILSFYNTFARGETPTIADTVSICADALSVNYRVGMAETALLNLWTTENMLEVSMTVIDFERLVALRDDLKKNSSQCA